MYVIKFDVPSFIMWVQDLLEEFGETKIAIHLKANVIPAKGMQCNEKNNKPRYRISMTKCLIWSHLFSHIFQENHTQFPKKVNIRESILLPHRWNLITEREFKCSILINRVMIQKKSEVNKKIKKNVIKWNI